MDDIIFYSRYVCDMIVVFAPKPSIEDIPLIIIKILKIYYR
jgi:hypothetical protein